MSKSPPFPDLFTARRDLIRRHGRRDAESIWQAIARVGFDDLHAVPPEKRGAVIAALATFGG